MGRLGGRCPGCRRRHDTRVAVRETGRPARCCERQTTSRGRGAVKLEDETVWSEDAEGRRVALTFTARRLLITRVPTREAMLVAHDVTAEQEAARARDGSSPRCRTMEANVLAASSQDAEHHGARGVGFEQRVIDP